MLPPLLGKRLQQSRPRHFLSLRPVQDRLDDVRREQRQPQDAGHVGGRDPLALGEFVDGDEFPGLQHPLPAEGAGQRLDEGSVGVTLLRGAAQKLPGGNVLITESDEGHAFEVTRDGKIVWEFWNPDVMGRDNPTRAVIYRMTRYPLDYLSGEIRASLESS